MRVLLTILSSFCLISSARAEWFSAPHIKPMASKAAGGLFEDTAAGDAFLPAGWALAIISFDAGGTLSQALDAYDNVKDILDFKNRLSQDFEARNYNALLGRVAELQNVLRRINYSFSMETRGEVLKFSYGNKRFGRVSVGGYWEGVAGLRLMAPNTDNIRAVLNVQGPFIDLGQDAEVVRGTGYGDIGGQISYGRVFSLPRGMEIAIGERVRVFRRYFVPVHSVTLSAKLAGEEDISVPDDFRYMAGFGVAMDLSAVFAFNDRYLDAMASVGLRNAAATVWYEDGAVWDRQKPSLEISVKPFHRLKHDRLVAGIMVDEVESDNATFGFGAAYTLGGTRVNLSPRIGFVAGRKDITGDKSNLFTAGLSTRLAVFSISGLYELNFAGGYNVGLALGVEI